MGPVLFMAICYLLIRLIFFFLTRMIMLLLVCYSENFINVLNLMGLNAGSRSNHS